jgi:predicted flavoprotein YhiN
MEQQPKLKQARQQEVSQGWQPEAELEQQLEPLLGQQMEQQLAALLEQQLEPQLAALLGKQLVVESEPLPEPELEQRQGRQRGPLQVQPWGLRLEEILALRREEEAQPVGALSED